MHLYVTSILMTFHKLLAKTKLTSKYTYAISYASKVCIYLDRLSSVDRSQKILDKLQIGPLKMKQV